MPSKMQTIYLMGRHYKVRCPDEEEPALKAVAAKLNDCIQETQRNSGLSAREDIIMMTALNLCHQLWQLQRELSQQNSLTDSQAAGLVNNESKD